MSRLFWCAKRGRVAALLLACGYVAPAQVAILRIQVIEGEGVVHAPGSRRARPLTVEVTDETGKPVEGAVVSFLLPEDGPGGTFGNGLRTAVAATDSNGRAVSSSLQLNRTPGRFQIRIVVSKEQAHAGTVSFQYVAERAGATSSSGGAARTGSHSHAKWIAVAVVVAGGAVAGIAVANRPHNSAAAPAAPAGPSVGTPTITIGKP